MALRGPQLFQFGWGLEGTYGTPVALDTWLPAISENMANEAALVRDEGTYAGDRFGRFEQTKRGNVKCGGTITTGLYDQSLRELFQLLMGTEAGTGPYTYSAGELSASATVGVVKPGVDDEEEWQFAGAKLRGATFTLPQGEAATVQWDWVAQSAVLSDTPSTATYASGLDFMVATGMTVSLTGAATFNVKGMTFRVQNGLADDRYHADSTAIKEPIEAGRRMVEATVTIEYPDITYVNDQLNGTEVDLAATISAGAESVAFALNGEVRESRQDVSQRTGLVEQTITLEGWRQSAGGAESTAFNLVYTTV